MKKALAIFEKFHKGIKGKKKYGVLNLPKALVHLGYVDSIVYTAEKGKSVDTYEHEFDTPPALYCDENGNSLMIIGDDIKITSRGIEG
ncbi:hypothetical protein JW935_05945 [candidate division KSB1 bacterium]|nr:hypothetical protein [candidate division KSB1 bacterium]